MIWWYDLTYTTEDMMQINIAWLRVECYGMLFRYDLCLCVYVYGYVPWNYHSEETWKQGLRDLMLSWWKYLMRYMVIRCGMMKW